MGVRRQREPRFLWTGLLILGPVLTLGAVGILQLRKDKAAALAEARERAGQLARLFATSGGPALRVTGGMRWETRALLREDGAPHKAFLYSDPPQPVATPDRAAEELARLQADIEAPPAERMDRALRIASKGKTAGGIPVQPLAVRHALRMAIQAGEPEERISEMAERLARLAVYHASVLTEPLLDSVAEVLGEDHRVLIAERERWRSDEATRELLRRHGREIHTLWNRARTATIPQSPNTFSARNRVFVTELASDTPMLCRLRGIHGGFELATIEADGMQDYILEDPILLNLPEHFGFRLWVDGQRFAAQRAWEGAEILAVHVDTEMATRVEVTLADAIALFAPVAERRRRTTLLIALATFAAAVGWLAAWRAFVRQRQLAAMKDNFVSAVSHELKAPVAAIGLMAEEMGRGRGKREQYAQLIAGECARLGSLVENVLDYARIEQGREEFEFEDADVGELVRAAADLMRPMAERRGMGIEVEAPPAGELSAEVDARALGRALVNLIDNAIKYAPADTPITVTAQRVEPDGAQITVADKGAPISAAEREHIFDKFYRSGSELTRETEGVGIGLSLVRHIARAHGGRAFVESGPAGNRFVFESHHGKD